VWGDVSVEGDKLVITIPETWLSHAVYPVVVDPTVGTSTVGAQTHWYDPDNEETMRLYVELGIALNRFLIPETLNGTATAYLYAYYDDYESPVRPVFYSDSGNKPQTRESKSEGQFDVAIGSGKSAGWRSASITTDGSLASGSYIWFGFSSLFFCPRFDYGATCYRFMVDDFEDYAPSPIPSWATASGYDLKLSMYFSYTSAPAAQNYTRTITQSVKAIDMQKNIAAYTRTASMSVRGSTILNKVSNYVRKQAETAQGNTVLQKAANYSRKHSATTGVTSNVLSIHGIVHKIIDSVKTFALSLPFSAFSRAVSESAKNGDSVTRGIGFNRVVAHSVNSATFTEGSRGVFRTITEIFSARDTHAVSLSWLRVVSEQGHTTDAIGGFREYVRRLYADAGNMAETAHSADYYRFQEDTVIT
jgi:hypothetical protein